MSPISRYCEELYTIIYRRYIDFCTNDLIRQEEEQKAKKLAHKKNGLNFLEKQESKLVKEEKELTENDYEKYLNSTWEALRDSEYYSFFFELESLDSFLVISKNSVFDKKRIKKKKVKKKVAPEEKIKDENESKVNSVITVPEAKIDLNPVPVLPKHPEIECVVNKEANLEKKVNEQKKEIILPNERKPENREEVKKINPKPKQKNMNKPIEKVKSQKDPKIEKMEKKKSEQEKIAYEKNLANVFQQFAEKTGTPSKAKKGAKKDNKKKKGRKSPIVTSKSPPSQQNSDSSKGQGEDKKSSRGTSQNQKKTDKLSEGWETQDSPYDYNQSNLALVNAQDLPRFIVPCIVDKLNIEFANKLNEEIKSMISYYSEYNLSMQPICENIKSQISSYADQIFPSKIKQIH